MELVDFIRVVIRWKWLVLTLVFIFTGYSFFSAVRSQEKYRAEATIVTGLSQISLLATGGSDIGSIDIANHGDNIAATYAEIITSQPVLSRALKQTGLDLPAEALKGKIHTSISKDTPVLKVSVEDTDAERAIVLANALSETFVQYIKDTGQATLDSAKYRISQELTSVQNEIYVEQEADESNSTKMKVLQDKRDLLLGEYNDVLKLELRAGDMNVVDPANSSKVVETKTNQKAMIVFLAGMMVAGMAAFVAEGVSRAKTAVRKEV